MLCSEVQYMWSIIKPQRKKSTWAKTGGLTDQLVRPYLPVYEFGNNSPNRELTSVYCYNELRPSEEPISDRIAKLLTGYNCPAFDDNRILWIFIEKVIWTYHSLGVYTTPECYILLSKSSLWSFSGFSEPQIWVFWLSTETKTGMTYSSERRFDLRIKNQTTCCPQAIEEKPLIDYNIVFVTDVLFSSGMETFEPAFPLCYIQLSKESVNLQLLFSRIFSGAGRTMNWLFATSARKLGYSLNKFCFRQLLYW